MNHQYIYSNGKAIVKDHNGNQTTVDYHDNLKEVLEQENLIEILDNMPDISDERKRFARRNYAYRSMTLDRIREDHDANKLTRRRIYSKVDRDERMSS